jgi:hypothetical protein
VSQTLKVHFPGHQRIEDIQRPFMRVLTDIYTFHSPGADHFDIGNHGYGYGIPWVAMPLAALGFVAAVWKGIFARVTGGSSAMTDNLILTTVPVLITAPFSPALWSARYNIHVAAGIMLLAVFATSGRGLRLFGEAPAAASLVMSFLFIYFAVPPAFNLTLEDARHMAAVEADERAAFEWGGNWGLRDFQRRREHDLKPHDIVAFTDPYLFPAFLWNERYENDVLFVRYTSGPQFLSDLDAAHVKWVTAHAGRTGYPDLQGSPTWEEMGPITRNSERWTLFRRR